MELNDPPHCFRAWPNSHDRSRTNHQKDPALAGMAAPDPGDPLCRLFVDAVVEARRATVAAAVLPSIESHQHSTRQRVVSNNVQKIETPCMTAMLLVKKMCHPTGQY